MRRLIRVPGGSSLSAAATPRIEETRMDRLWQFIARQLAATGQFPPVTVAPPATTDEATSGGGIALEQVFHDAARAYLDQQVASNRDLDARTAQSIQIGSVVVTITFGLLALGKSQIHVPDHAKTCLYVALAAYSLMLVLAFAASRFNTLSYQPDIPTLAGYVDDFAGVELLHWVALEYTTSGQVNEKRLGWKGLLIGTSVICLYFEGIFLALAAFFTLR
jgi:hypothetical protein